MNQAEEWGFRSISVSGYNPKTNEGVRFQDIDYSYYDVIITNPPFSQFDEFIDLLIKNGKEFLVICVLLELKVLSYRKLKLVDEDLLESIEIVLLVEYKHRLLVVDRINRAEAQRTIAVGY